VVNGHYESFGDMKVTAKIYDLDMGQRYSKTAIVSIAPDTSNKIFVIDQPKDLSKTYFLKLELKDKADNMVSSNFYWLSTGPDASADFSDLENLAEVDVDVSYAVEKEGDTCLVYVDLKNPSSELAFAVNPKITKSISGDLVLPIYWQDNYFSLLPGERQRVKAEFDVKDMGTEGLSLVIEGWNIKTEKVKIKIGS
jgi:exo-1,4-beta-D-glucosaminidase